MAEITERQRELKRDRRYRERRKQQPQSDSGQRQGGLDFSVRWTLYQKHVVDQLRTEVRMKHMKHRHAANEELAGLEPRLKQRINDLVTSGVMPPEFNSLDEIKLSCSWTRQEVWEWGGLKPKFGSFSGYAGEGWVE